MRLLNNRRGSTVTLVLAVLLAGTILAGVLVTKAFQLNKLSDHYPETIFISPPTTTELEADLSPKVDCMTTLAEYSKTTPIGSYLALLRKIPYQEHLANGLNTFYGTGGKTDTPLISISSTGTNYTVASGKVYNLKSKWVRREFIDGVNEHEFEISAKNSSGVYEKVFSLVCPRKCPSTAVQPCWAP